MTETELRNLVVETAKKHLGKKESDGSHKEIIDIYNSHKPLARRYSVKYTDAWCATFVSAVAIQCGLTSIMFTECSCEKMIALYKKKNRWMEDDSYRPKLGDIVMYDWADSGKGDNTGAADHVGIVAYISNNTMKIIEGNISDAVNYRTLSVNAKYIRGYCLPDYASKADKKPVEKPEAEKKTEPVKDTKKAKEPAMKQDKAVAGTYKVTAMLLNVRNGAGTKANEFGKDKTILVAIPKNTEVKCYGYYTEVKGTKWLYVQFTYKDITYTGFASANYLAKK